MSDLISMSMKERVALQVKNQGLEVDQYKKDFETRQATQTKVLQESKVNSMKNIREHEQKIKDFEATKAAKEKQIKELQATNKALDQIHLNLITDELYANKLAGK